MENRTITANCDNGRLSDNLLSMQYDNNRTVVEFANAPTAEKYYILVYMKMHEDADPVMMSPIELTGASWTVSNVYTQIVQTVRFQLCCLDEATNHIEAHSKVFNGQISDSLEHDGTVQDVDVTELFDAYREYINQLVVAAGAIVIDPTLSVQGAAADAKAVGDRIAELEQGGTGGLTADVKAALLACFNHVAWDSADPTGQSYISALQTALYPPANLSRITAVYTQAGTVYDTASLDSLRTNLVVTAYYDNSTSEVISNYTLSGTLSEGTSTITAAYGGKTATFTVNVTSLTETVTVSWSGTGTNKISSVIDARNADVYWALPFVEGYEGYTSGVTRDSDFVRVKAMLYSDAEQTTSAGIYYIDTQEISNADRTDLNTPTMPTDTQIKVAPAGYYVVLKVAKRGGFTSNGTCGTFLNTYATDVKLMAVGGA